MLKLRLQFFIVMLVVCGLLTTGLYVFINYSFKQDFWTYVERKETHFAQPLIKDLTVKYHDHNNWLWISDWNNYVATTLDAETREHLRALMKKKLAEKNSAQEKNDDDQDDETEHTSGHEAHHENHDDFHKPHDWRDLRRIPPASALQFIFLLDEHKQLIAGKSLPLNDVFLIPLKDQEKHIGYLAIPFNPAIRNLQDADFAQGQENKLSIVIIVALMIASLAAFPLAHLLTKRINFLVNQVNRFSRGNYREKVNLQGYDELSELAIHLNHLGDTLEKSEQTRRQWVADISHELRTPIAVLQAELEAMEDGVRPLDKESVTRLMNHSQRLKHLVNDLYELSLTDLGGMTYRKTTVDLAALLNDTIHSMQPQFAMQHIDLKLTIHHSPVFMFGDSNRLQQLFVNLLKNSLQYTNAPGTTQITLNTDHGHAILSIEDTAPGVAPEHHAKLFDRLYRADSSRHRSTGGAGLGLSICKNIVNAHEGTITTGNSQLGGLNITIHFPCTENTL